MITLSGIGLHSGQQATVHLHAHQGPVCFKVGNATIPALASYVSDTSRCTVLSHQGQSVAMVEHLLAALHLKGIWNNLLIELEGPEVPILDGSAQPWMEALEGFSAHTPVEPFVLGKEFAAQEERAQTMIQPHPTWALTCTIAFAHPKIGYQKLDCTQDNWLTLAAARTFGFLSELEQLQRAGLALGATQDNVVPYSEADAIVPLRMTQEPVAHKALDFIGDMYLVGRPITAKHIAHRAGHKVHVALAKQLQHYLGVSA